MNNTIPYNKKYIGGWVRYLQESDPVWFCYGKCYASVYREWVEADYSISLYFPDRAIARTYYVDPDGRTWFGDQVILPIDDDVFIINRCKY